MTHDQDLAARVRAVIGDDVTERRMFGGLAFLLHGNMVCGVTRDELLMLRLGPELGDEALEHPHARPMDMTGRPMRGMVLVDPPGFAADADLAAWIGRARGFAETLPPKR